MKIIFELFESIFPHKHKWQTRSVNRYGNTMYRFCTKCGERQHRTNKALEADKFEKCEPKPEFDKQFNSNNEYIL